MERSINKNNLIEIDPSNEKMMNIIELAISNG